MMSDTRKKPAQQSSLLAFFALIPSNGACPSGGNDEEERSTRKRPLPVGSEPPVPSPQPAPQDKRHKFGHGRSSEVVCQERGWRVVEACDNGRCTVYEDGEGGRLRYWPSFMPIDEATLLYNQLRDETEWSQGGTRKTDKADQLSTKPAIPAPHANVEDLDRGKEGEWMRGRATYVNTHGKVVSTPRLQKHYGRGIAGGSKFRCGYREWPPELWRIKARVEETAGQPYNFVLLNYYRNENDHMSLHTDAGPFLGINPSIASLSVGAARRFVLKYANSQAKPAVPSFELNLANGSLLVMEGTTQHNWLHSVPKLRAITGGRINLTFRFVLDQYGDDRGQKHNDACNKQAAP